MKKKWIQILGFTLLSLGLISASLITYVKVALPNVGAPQDLVIEHSSTQVARGEYLANSVMVCMQCHSQRDWDVFAGPSKPDTRGMGGEVHDHRLGFPGKYISSNITPYGLGDWTDGEVFRAITTGVAKDGRALFPIMPHHNFGQLDQEDIYSVIAYLRTLQPIEFVPEQSHSDFPMNIIINTIPQKANLKPIPPKENKVAYGKYLVTAASCFDCHTKMENGSVTGQPFAGGMEFPMEDGSIVRSPNITPHPTGIGSWSAEQFVSRFKLYSDSNYVAPKVSHGGFQTVMPWYTFSNMTEEDLEAIFQYLKTVAPVETRIEKFTSSSTSTKN
ncbi:MAG: c-type cytochrome [Saprospirales bacterium]|nr:c-type cytochrome [Saprospirales bacterium]